MKLLKRVWERTHPAKRSNGLIDSDEVFKLAIGRLKLPLDALDKLTLSEIVLLIEQDQEDREEFYETIAVAFQLGYVNARSKGKNKRLFSNKTSSGQPMKHESIESKEKLIHDLKTEFGYNN